MRPIGLNVAKRGCLKKHLLLMTWVTYVLLLQAEKEKGEWAWVSMNRIKKMFTKLNKQEEQQQQAGIEPGMPMRCIVSRLPAWPKSEPMYIQFQDKLLDSASEKSRSACFCIFNPCYLAMAHYHASMPFGHVISLPFDDVAPFIHRKC